MNALRWRQIDELFNAAVSRPAAERARFLERDCAADRSLRAEVESLLAAHERASSGFIEHPYDVSLRRKGDAAPPIAAGQRIGRYTLRGVLGRGGTGMVYEAQQDDPVRIVALKVMRALPYLDELTARLFRREAKALARLEHPSIATIYEAGRTDDGCCYFAMERVEGAPLTTYAAEQQLSIRQRLELFKRVCDAVHYAHQRGVIHRDLKPSNILVTPDGQPKVLDFGLARIVDPDGDVTQITQAGLLQGTLAYASPEQVRGEPHEIDVRSDVYSLGVMVYELVAGRRPYELSNNSLPAAVRMICEQAPPAPSKVRFESDGPPNDGSRRMRLDGEIDAIVLKCLAKEPPRRYQSAAELAGDIHHYLAGEPIGARRDNLAYVARKWLARHRAAATVAGLLAALLAASLWALFQSRQAARSKAEATVQARISAIRSALPHPPNLERPGAPEADAAASVWALAREGRATQAEMGALAEASVRLDFTEPSLLDLGLHAVREGGYAIGYTTRVYGCPPACGFLLQPKFILDGSPLPADGAVFRAAQRRLRHALHAPELAVGQHTLGGELEVVLARVAEPAEAADRRYVPISQPFIRPLGPYHFAAVAEHPPDYPVKIPASSYQDKLARELLLAACLAREPSLPRQPAPIRDELHVVLTFPPPPLELALRIDIQALGFATSIDVAIAASAEDGLPELVFHNALLRPLFDVEACRATLRVPFSAILVTANPESLLGTVVRVELTASRDAARSADFERFLDVSQACEARIRDVRSP